MAATLESWSASHFTRWERRGRPPLRGPALDEVALHYLRAYRI